MSKRRKAGFGEAEAWRWKGNHHNTIFCHFRKYYGLGVFQSYYSPLPECLSYPIPFPLLDSHTQCEQLPHLALALALCTVDCLGPTTACHGHSQNPETGGVWICIECSDLYLHQVLIHLKTN